MKIDEPIYVVRVMIPNVQKTYSDTTLFDNLRNTLRATCIKFLNATDNITENMLDDVQVLAIDQRIAISQYLTGLKIQKFANNAAINDNITLEKEVNDFLKQYKKITNE